MGTLQRRLRMACVGFASLAFTLMGTQVIHPQHECSPYHSCTSPSQHERMLSPASFYDLQHRSKPGSALHERLHIPLVSRRLMELSKGQSEALGVLGGPVQQAIKTSCVTPGPSLTEVPDCFLHHHPHTLIISFLAAFFWHFLTCFFLRYISQGRLPDEQQIIINSSGICSNTINPLHTTPLKNISLPEEHPSPHPSPHLHSGDQNPVHGPKNT